MKKLWYCLAKDVTLSLKSFYFYMEVGMALIFIAVLLLAVPEQPDSRTDVYAFIDMADEAFEDGVLSGDMNMIRVDSRDEIEGSLAKNRNAVGLHIYTNGGKPVFELILQGYEDAKLRNMMETAIKSAFSSQMPGHADPVPVTTLGRNLERLDNRTNLLPIFLTMNAAFMGLFIIASYIFLDKEEGTIKALAVTPARIWQYLMSKLLVMLMTGTVTSLIVMLSIAGRNADYFLFFIAIICFNCFGSALGLFIASFFDTMSKAMGWLFFSIIILALASVSYFMPAFSPPAIRLLPSYPMLFSFRELLLAEGDAGYVLRTSGAFLAGGAILFMLSDIRFRKTITV